MVLPTTLPLLWFQVQLATDMLNMMNRSVDPCEDFYEYACGKYSANTKIPDDKPYVSSLIDMQDKMMDQLRVIIDSDQASTSASPSAQFVSLYYKACTNIPALESVGLKTLEETLQSFGGWPIVEGAKWDGNDYDWIAANAKLGHRTGISPIIYFDVMADFENSTRNMLQVDQPKLGLGKRDYYVDKNNSKAIDAYRHFIAVTAVQLGADNETAFEDAAKIVELETALATISVRDEERRDITHRYTPMSVKELKTKYPKISFQTWFDYATNNGWAFDDSSVVNAESVPYLEQLPEVLSNFSSRTVASYQLWMLVQDLVRYLAPSLRENLRQYQEILSGTPKFEPRWKECLTSMLKYLKWPLSSIYIKNYFNSQHKAYVDRMVTNIRQSMKPTINDAEWMDEATKTHALEKLSTMISNMAYPPDEIYNETWLMRDFKQASLKENAYMENYLSISASMEARRRSEFYDAINRTRWNGMPPAMVNAFYSSTENKMTFPAGILRYPLFSPTAPAYVNYGRIGVVMGHELTHGYDDQGRQFDSQGNFALWWTNTTLAKFKQDAKCFVNQYGSIVDKRTGQTLNGENTQGENIADNGGVKLAHKAYNLWRESAQEEEKSMVLPGFQNYTTDQLFFLSFAQVWCQAIRTQTLRVLIIRDPHAPAKYRANVPLQNNADFAAAFACPEGSAMNPKEKCTLW